MTETTKIECPECGGTDVSHTTRKEKRCKQCLTDFEIKVC